MSNNNRNEFRKNNNKDGKGHPSYIYAKVGNKYKFIGITHSKITDGIANIQLEKNPEPGNNTVAYIRPTTQEAHRSSFGKKLSKWSFSDNDKEKVRKIIEDNEKNN